MKKSLGNKTDIRMSVGARVYGVKLEESETAEQFRKLLPITLKMPDLNGNEKHVKLPKSLVDKATKPKQIENGDLMLYGDQTLVLFYKSFATKYSYTKLGSVQDPESLEAALGAGDAAVTFEEAED